jgi:hypothetical protein
MSKHVVVQPTGLQPSNSAQRIIEVAKAQPGQPSVGELGDSDPTKPTTTQTGTITFTSPGPETGD